VSSASHSDGTNLVRLLATGILVTGADTGAAGTVHFEPGGVSFWDFSGLAAGDASTAFAGCAPGAIGAGAG